MKFCNHMIISGFLIKEAYINDSWMFDESITDEELTEAYKQIDQIEKPN